MQQTTVPLQPPPQRKRSLPPALRIDPHPQQPQVDLVVENDAPVLDGPVVAAPPLTKPRSLRNMKGLALALPPTNSRPASPPVPPTPSVATQQQRRRPSIVSLPPATASTSAMAFRANEGDSPSAPYLDGPIEIMPKIWLGAEDNARDWPRLIERGIRSVLNVAKEVTEPFGSSTEQQPLRPFQSTPNLQKTTNSAPDATSTYIPAHRPSGRPGMHYLKLPWSHGQADLVGEGFVAAMAFVDQSLERGDGVLIHCQCGVSRSATLVIALVMRAAAHATNDTPADIAALKGQGMHSAYAYVKEKSKYIGPNMSLMYQLLEYEGALNRASGASPSVSDRSSAIAEEEEEWERRRRELDELDSPEDKERESLELMKEAQALDRQMEERIVARKDSIISSGASTLSSHSHGMGGPWKSRFAGGYGRTRTGSIGSNYTARSSISLLSEELVEEEEEGIVADGMRTPSTAATDEDAHLFTFAKETDPSRRPPPSAPPTKQSFNFPSRPSQKKENRRRPPPLAPVPSSPLDPPPPPPQEPSPPVQAPTRRRAAPPPLKLALPPVPPSAVIEPIQSPSFKSRTSASTSRRSSHNSAKRIPFSPREAPLQTPSQTLFVFPPEPSNIRTPSTMMLTSLAMPSPTPRGAAFKREGRRSWLSFGIPPTPTTAFSIVDAKGWVGVGS